MTHLSPEKVLDEIRSQGYAYVSSIVSSTAISAARSALASVLAEFHVLDPRADPAQLLVKAGTSLCRGDRLYDEIFAAAYRCPEIHELPHEPAFQELVAAIYNEEAFLLPAHMLRVCFPTDEKESGTTPYHQDFGGSQGSERALTLWCPLDSYQPKDGTLAIARGRHREGLFRPGISTRGVFEIANDFSGDEITGPVHSGDILLFSAFTPHRAMPNHSNRVRVSVDFRFQPVRDPVSEMFVGDLCPLADCTWADLYCDMPGLSPRCQNYWTALPLTTYAHNNEFLERELLIALREAEAGHIGAAPILQCALHSPGVPIPYQRRARQLLKSLANSAPNL